MVMKTKDEGSHKCYVSTFDRTSVTAPDVDKDQSMVRLTVYVYPCMSNDGIYIPYQFNKFIRNLRVFGGIFF